MPNSYSGFFFTFNALPQVRHFLDSVVIHNAVPFLENPSHLSCRHGLDVRIHGEFVRREHHDVGSSCANVNEVFGDYWCRYLLFTYIATVNFITIFRENYQLFVVHSAYLRIQQPRIWMRVRPELRQSILKVNNNRYISSREIRPCQESD